VERRSSGCFEQTRSVCALKKASMTLTHVYIHWVTGATKAVNSESQLAGDEKKAPDSAGSGGCMDESKLTDASL
jgi:hypothetical protein